jgi:drug/metabolite transporter (DMT)-like permease
MTFAITSTQYGGIAFALGACFLWGTSDFGASVLGKHTSARFASAAVYLVEVPILTLVYLFHRETAPVATNAWLFVIGCAGTLAYFAFIHGMSQGFISIVTPLAALISLILPAIVSVASGDKTTVLLWIGMAIVGCAIYLVTKPEIPEIEEDKAQHFIIVRTSIITGCIAGTCWGLYVIGLGHVDAPVISKLFFLQIAGFFYSLYWAAKHPEELRQLKKYLGILIIFALAYQLGQMCIPWSTDRTTLAVTNIVASLYPGVTVACAAIFLKERTGKVQNLGFLVAVIGLVLVTLGLG